jgi:Asp-tRNA(Asn)/Glu-tRNA(Gln) amidotransferase A subunit family amidase
MREQRPESSTTPTGGHIDRRQFMAYFAALSPGLWALAQEEEPRITKDMLAQAEAVAGLQFTDAERELMLDGLNRNLEAYEQLREVHIPNSVYPALLFDPVLPDRMPEVRRQPKRRTRHPEVRRPADLEEAAFWSVTDLAELVHSRQVSSVELTRMYLDRLERHAPKLECVVTFTEELAMRQARRADAELAQGHYRGPLHGIPWGAKDLLAEDEYRTTWGAKPYEEQVIPYDAAVVRRLEEAGAVLIAKMTLGALAMGDVWFGGKTRNPWDLEQGSSGSSAGSASATVAGCLGFSIGSETLGSIVSPSTRCGATGLRPTFGRVSRDGAMALSWSMDKLGPICRTVEDCALVLDAIHGADGKDPTARDLPFDWNAELAPTDLRIGYYKSAFEAEHDWYDFDMQALAALRSLGVDPVPVELPDQIPVGALRFLLSVEAAAANDELTRSDRDDLLVRQDARAWPTSFRRSRLVPAVEYVQANRARTMLMAAMDAVMDGIDVFITPSYGGSVLLTTNLTGHPAVTLPHGFRDNGTPVSISFIGQLYGEAELLAVAKAWQDATGFHLRHPPDFV